MFERVGCTVSGVTARLVSIMENVDDTRDLSALLDPSELPYQLPDFARVRTEDFLPAFHQALATYREEIDAIARNPEPATWSNTMEALEGAGQELNRVATIFFNLQGTDSTPELNEIAAQVVPEMSAASDAVYHNPALWDRIKGLQVPDSLGEDYPEAVRLLDQTKRNFVRHGAELNPEEKEELSALNQRLASLSEQFGRKLLADTQELAVLFDTAEELEGLPASRIEAARKAAKDAGKEGYLVALELPSVQSAQTRLTRPESRARLYNAAAQRGEGENAETLLELVQLRARRAQLVSYDTHADYVISEETAGSAAAARSLLEDLTPAAVTNAAGEHKLLAEAATAAGEDFTAADWPYWQAKVRERDLALDQEEVAQYFPLNQVLEDGVFYAAHRLYGITVDKREDLHGYHPEVEVWEVKDADGSGIGLLLTDYFGRPSKRGGAWMSSFVDQSRFLDTKPVVVNVMGMSKPADGTQPLLTIDEVTTVFHEFGHALHGLLSDVRYPTMSGTNVPRDWVEFPSQINENWAFDPAIVAKYARHVDTGEVLPDATLSALRQAQQDGQGFATTEYLEASLIDLAWHSLSPSQVEEILADAQERGADRVVADFEAQILGEAGVDETTQAAIAPRYRSQYFNHIFAGGYSAGYYSYLWAEALDADGFDGFTEHGAAGPSESDEKARAAGQRFRDLVLSRGASRDYQEAFRAFRGRDKEVGPLLRRRGLAGAL